jgi:DNA polymerase I-like protein with 3'-5' exonuclease and polymerase domains
LGEILVPVVATHQLAPNDLHGPHGDQIYNGLDCAVTYEVWETLQTFFNEPPPVYAFERALQAPALEMMLRGILVDFSERDRAIKVEEEKLKRIEYVLERYVKAVWDKPLRRNPMGRLIFPNSTEELLEFFIGAMKVPESLMTIRDKGRERQSANREVLEKLELYFHAKPIAAAILAFRDICKTLQDLHSGIDSDGHMRSSINVGATETGRFSSSKSTTGSGRNMFNVPDDGRRMFVSEPGWKFCGIDLEQAESREVGWLLWILFGDGSYLDACEGGDLHTTVAKMVWPELRWPGDNGKGDREIADTLFYRHYSHRYMAKRGGHGSNYLLTPWTASRQLKCPLKTMEEFHERYFSAFPGIAKWHQWVAEQIQTTQQLTTIFGRQRHFFGRPGDDTTIREAVAYCPQSSTADRLNVGLNRVWWKMGERVRVALQLYDAIYFQYREEDNEAEVVTQALNLIQDTPFHHNGRTFIVPGEIKVGWNWGSYVSEADAKKAYERGEKNVLVNLDGLKKWKGGDDRKRTPLLDKIM